ncbi:MAG: M48 family metallopeptidase [Candidatus Kapaibacterium sp.]
MDGTAMRKKLFNPVYLLISLIGIACGANFYTIQQDRQLGDDIDREIKAAPKEYPPYDNEQVRSYVQNIVNTIVRSPEVKYKGTFAYKVTMINDDRTVNAFATPGGYIYVYTGLLRFCENEAMLAGVLAHEIAHAEERHGTEHMTRDNIASTGLSLALGSNPSEVAKIAASSANLLASLANSREDELEADTKGFGYLRSTPWWPGGIKLFFQKMLDQQKRGTAFFEAWLSTHPAPEDRVTNMEKLMKENKTPAPTEDNLMSANYRSMLRSMR